MVTGGVEDQGEPYAPTVEVTLLVEAEILGLRRLAFAHTGSWTAAEDLVQDILAAAYRRWDHVRRDREPVAWARRAVLNRSASWHRSRGRERRALTRVAGRAEVAGPDDPTFEDPELWSAIRSLSERQIEVVLLLWFEDLSAREVGVVLGCSEETVRTHWRRTRDHLARALGEQEERSS